VGNIVPFGGYEWRVLEVRDGKALLLSEYVLEWRAYNEEYTDVTWETCTLRSYLNGEFYNSFSDSDRMRIAETLNENKDNQWWGTEGGADTSDRIFLLSLDEVVRYFGDSGQLANRPSEDSWYIDDEYNEARIAYAATDLTYTYSNGETYTIEAGTASWWWLRSPGSSSRDAAVVNRGGSLVVVDGYYVVYDYGGIRPALWLNLE
jgi:hypothetical protein